MTTEADKRHAQNLSASEEDGVRCELDGVWVHSIPAYLNYLYPDMSLEQYQAQFCDAKLYSPRMQAVLDKKGAQQPVAAMTATVHKLHPSTQSTMQPFAKVFGLGEAPAAKNKRGDDIMVEVLGDAHPDFAGFIPPVDDKYVFDIDLLKAVHIGMRLRKNILLWGKHGTGKTTVAEQYCAHTRRPSIRVQHTISTEEAHVLGQYILVGGDTVFNPGPLAYAMRFGLTYIADEYDFALPAVTSVYQPVLEGKALVIKEAPPEWRVVEPHENFRFIATGNTNGGGDETGLYQGTQLQNAANYSRFGVTYEVRYMPKEQETAVVASQAGVFPADAEVIVNIGNLVRDAYARGDIGVTVSPRELINSAEIGRAMGGDWRTGLAFSFTNRLNTTDREAVNQMIQRHLPVI